MKPRCIALLGIGHTNAHIVRKWASSPIENCRLVCISKFPITTYSGMLPGTLAGQFDREEMQIDLQELAKRAKAVLRLDEVTGIDHHSQTLLFRNSEPLPFDALSIGIGSVPAGVSEFTADSVVPIKPMQTFIDRLDERLSFNSDIIIVGGGVAGVEVALCLHSRLKRQYPQSAAAIQIITRGDEIADGMRPQSRVRLRKILADRGITVRTKLSVTEITGEQVITSDGAQRRASCVILATGAVAPPVLGNLGLPTDDRGFIATTHTLRSTSGAPIFAVGDSGTIIDDPAPKAGVYAVRQASVLWRNLQATLLEAALAEYQPQHDFLKILNTGDGKALLQYKALSFHAGWCNRLKTWIDTRFIRQYQ